jgi:nucleoid-associated protein YgaU
VPVETPAQLVAQLTEPAATADTSPPPPGRFGRFHVVRRGESLWSIATDLLGAGASASAIASEVRRLWELNEQRIGTGDPNLLVVGVRLRLR